MRAFDEIRAKAKERRDKAIRQAREEYTKTIQDVAALEMRLAPPPPIERPKTVRTKPLIDLIVDLLPRDRVFNVDELFGWVNETDPEREPTKATVRTNVHRLLRQGVLKRITDADADAGGTRRATFAVASLEADREPTMREWAEKIMAEADGPLEPDKLLVRMLEAGFQPDCDPKQALDSLKRMLAK